MWGHLCVVISVWGQLNVGSSMLGVISVCDHLSMVSSQCFIISVWGRLSMWSSQCVVFSRFGHLSVGSSHCWVISVWGHLLEWLFLQDLGPLLAGDVCTFIIIEIFLFDKF